MRQRRQLRAHLVDARRVDLRQHHAFAFFAHRQHLAPGVHDHAVAPGSAAVFVRAALRGGQHVALVLDGARAQQQLPVGAAGGVGEGRGHTQHVAGRQHQRAVQLGEAQVVADAQAHAQSAGLHRHRAVASLQRAAFVVALAAVVEGEKMDLVVVPGFAAVGRVHHAAVEHAVGAGGLHRQRAAHQPHAVLGRRGRQKALHRPGGAVAGGLGQGQLVGVVVAHQAEVLRQGHQRGAGLCRLAHQPGGGVEVAGHVGRGDHLHGGDLHGFIVRRDALLDAWAMQSALPSWHKRCPASAASGRQFAMSSEGTRMSATTRRRRTGTAASA